MSALSAAESPVSAMGYPASKITVNLRDPCDATLRIRTVSAGTGKSSVLSLLGKPAEVPSPDVFVYYNCEPDQAVARGHSCNVLVITFAQNKVADLKFVNSAGAAVLAANVRKSGTRNIASGAPANNPRDNALPNK
jgi:hypothetical protein